MAMTKYGPSANSANPASADEDEEEEELDAPTWR
jgi:hypothetical protein